MAEEEKKRRFKPDVRKAQIIEATKELILENGLAWASSLRISKALGISQAALYHHFSSKREILLATLSSIIDDIVTKTTRSRPGEEIHGNEPQGKPGKHYDAASGGEFDPQDIEGYIHEAAHTFYYLTIANPRQSRLLVEYLCAPPTENMREELQMIFSGLIDTAEEIVQKGIAQGRFREDLDLSGIAWIFISLAITLSVGSMLEVPKFLSEEQALNAIDLILRAIRR